MGTQDEQFQLGSDIETAFKSTSAGLFNLENFNFPDEELH